jgi:hypothetical protein
MCNYVWGFLRCRVTSLNQIWLSLSEPISTRTWRSSPLSPVSRTPGAGPSTAPSPSRGVGLRRRVQRALSGRRGCWGCAGRRARGRRSFWEASPGWWFAAGHTAGFGPGGCERGMGPGSGDDTVGGYACCLVRALQPRVLRGEGRPHRPGRLCPTRWGKPWGKPLSGSGDAFKGGRGVRGASATVIWRDLHRSRHRYELDPQPLGASAPDRRYRPR